LVGSNDAVFTEGIGVVVPRLADGDVIVLAVLLHNGREDILAKVAKYLRFGRLDSPLGCAGEARMVAAELGRRVASFRHGGLFLGLEFVG
jgi:hypothetical protein